MIEVEGLSKAFGGLPALRGISFSVPSGSVCALLGHNGAGKTTTVKILSTLIKPDSGKAIVAGYDVVRQTEQVRASIGVTGQEVALDPMLTARENLALFGRLWGMSRRDARTRADELVDHFGMEDAADRRVATYSGGMRRRIDIAAALVVTPKVLFLDEPTTGLDPHSRRNVWELVSALAAEGVTILLTTQYLEEADVLSDSIVIVNSGTVIETGTAEELKKRVGSSYCEVTAESAADLARIDAALSDFASRDIDRDNNSISVPAPDGVATLTEVFRRIDRLGIDLLDISLRKPSLDEVFIHLSSSSSSAR